MFLCVRQKQSFIYFHQNIYFVETSAFIHMENICFVILLHATSSNFFSKFYLFDYMFALYPVAHHNFITRHFIKLYLNKWIYFQYL